MSDVKVKRTARETGRSEVAPGEGVPIETVPAIVSEAPAASAAAAPPPIAASPLVPEAASESVEPVVAATDDAWTALAEMQAAFAHGVEQIAVEMMVMTRSGIAAAADAATAMLGARTLAEAVEINAGLARRGADAMIEGSARLSEIGVKAATESSRPILSRFATAWSSIGPG